MDGWKRLPTGVIKIRVMGFSTRYQTELKMRPIFHSVVLLIAVAARVQADTVNYLSDTRSAGVWIQTSSPYAQAPNAGSTNQPGTPFHDSHLNADCNVGWQPVNGWTAASTTGSASQDVSYDANQITVSSTLSVNVGGDPFGFHFPNPASGTVHAETMFEVSFNISTLMGYDYTFDFSPSPTLEAASLTLASVNHGTQQLFSTSGVPVEGVLAPDTYTLSGIFSSYASGAQAGNNFSSFTMNFTPTPEPTTGALLLLGAVSLGLWRRNRHS